MGMSIDNSIRLLEDYLEWQKLHEMDGTGIDEATRNLIDVAKKYQKIKDIYDYWNVDFGIEAHRAMMRIGEVLEDGRN